MKEIQGRLEPFFETGTEGVIWSVMDPSIPDYDGLWSLRNSDHLRVIGVDDAIVWEGTVKLEYRRNWQPYPTNRSYGQQAVCGYWVHGLQEDMEPERWAEMFFAHYRVAFQPGTKQEYWRSHPFTGSSAGMETRLRALPAKRQEELYKNTVYPWLHFYSNGDFFSFGKDWDFTVDEIVTLLDAANEIDALRQFGRMTFDWNRFIRVALLFGVYGALNWKFHDNSDVVKWLNEGESSAKDLLLSGGIVQVRDLLLNT